MTTITKEQLTRQLITRSGRCELRAEVTPGFGANLVSFNVDGDELIHYDESVMLASGDLTDMNGAFNMFPTPCRLVEAVYEFDGRTIRQAKGGEDASIHGLLRDEPLAFQNDGDRITSSVDITPDHPIYEGFPFACRFELTHALHEAGLYISFKLANRDRRPIPFGYGVHAFWRIGDARKDFAVRLPCDHTLELNEEIIPTGEVLPVEGTDMDLRGGRSMEGVYVDAAFWKRHPGDTSDVTWAARHRKLTIEASDNFPHMIVYAPQGQPFVCVENLTTCPNAPNLVTAGKGEVANMLIAEPGQTVEGWIKYTVESI